MLTTPFEESGMRESALVRVDFVFLVQKSLELQKQNLKLEFDIFPGSMVFSFHIQVVE